jgi:uncharacterized protein (DUF1499 family)
MTEDQEATVNAVILYLMGHAVPGARTISNKDAYLMSEFMCQVFHDGKTFDEARDYSIALSETIG